MREWVVAAQQGEREAFEQLVRRFDKMAFAVAFGRLRSEHLAEDAVQDAFTEAYVHLSGLERPEAFPGWLKRIVERQCSRILRRRRHETVPLRDAATVAEDREPLPDLVAQRELGRLIRHHIYRLPPATRDTVLMFYFQGYSLVEISSFLDTPVSAVKKRLFDARRKLKLALPVADSIAAFRQLYEGGLRMLHIVNGDSVGNKLKKGIVPGEILVWREIYSEGPAFADSAEAGNRAVRAAELENMLGIPRQDYIEGCESQEDKLSRFKDYDEIVLWFEHDLFDQTMLCYLLHWFSRQQLGRTKLHLLNVGSFPGIELFRGLGQLTVEQLGTLPGTWRPIGREELSLGHALWEAYASPDPRRLEELLQDDLAALPYARDAFRFHLTRYPSLHAGVGIVERTTLAYAAEGVERPSDLFRQAGDRLHWYGMGDLQFWAILKRMADGPYPLIRVEGSDASFPSYAKPMPDFIGKARIKLTDMGRRVLEGEADWASQQGVDCWLGGVRLEGKDRLWRWNEEKERLVAP